MALKRNGHLVCIVGMNIIMNHNRGSIVVHSRDEEGYGHDLKSFKIFLGDDGAALVM